MANTNSPMGAKIVGNALNGSYEGACRLFTIPATDATALFVGDFINVVGGSSLGDDNLYHPIATQAAAGDLLGGIVVDFLPNSDFLNQTYRTASTLRTALVSTDPYITFIMQATGATPATSDIDKNCDITAATAGSAATGLSGMMLDLATAGGATAQIRILNLYPSVDNEFGTYVKYLCMINEQQYKGTTGI